LIPKQRFPCGLYSDGDSAKLETPQRDLNGGQSDLISASALSPISRSELSGHMRSVVSACTRVLGHVLHGGILLLVLSSVLWACAKSTPPMTAPESMSGPPGRFSVLAYNVLHGLEVGRFWVRPGEPAEERAERFDLQFAQMAQVQPDVILLQEVNPLPDMAEAYVDGLKSFGLMYSAVHQVDACGIRLGATPRLIPGLNNGLAVLAKSPLRLRKLAGLKLSGGFGGCGDMIGFQTGALRYALIAEVEHPAAQGKVIVVSVHLHSGISRNEYFIQRIREAKEEGRLENPEEFDKVLAALEADQNRRIKELRTLIRELRRLQAQEDYLAVVIGGDFNFEPDSPEYQELKLAGLRDSHTIAQLDSELHTYDPQNPMVSREQEAVPAALSRAIGGLPEDRQQRILAEYRDGIGQARRIDFLFTMPGPSWKRNVCVTQEIFGKSDPASDRTGSDHYGVFSTYFFDRAEC
jgi:endonuclease/exonuclease/phosphatase family metal-dependent hydrolase